MAGELRAPYQNQLSNIQNSRSNKRKLSSDVENDPSSIADSQVVVDSSRISPNVKKKYKKTTEDNTMVHHQELASSSTLQNATGVYHNSFPHQHLSAERQLNYVPPDNYSTQYNPVFNNQGHVISTEYSTGVNYQGVVTPAGVYHINSPPQYSVGADQCNYIPSTQYNPALQNQGRITSSIQHNTEVNHQGIATSTQQNTGDYHILPHQHSIGEHLFNYVSSVNYSTPDNSAFQRQEHVTCTQDNTGVINKGLIASTQQNTGVYHSILPYQHSLGANLYNYVPPANYSTRYNPPSQSQHNTGVNHEGIITSTQQNTDVSTNNLTHQTVEEKVSEENRETSKDCKTTHPETLEECLICAEEYNNKSSNWNILKCSHKICVICYKQIEKTRTTMSGATHTFVKCPFCQGTTGIEIGICPNGKMTSGLVPTYCVGYEQYNSILINYRISEGNYYLNRAAYLPNNDQGRYILNLLQIAWDRRISFTIGTSITTGQEDTVVWNIHHKTSQSGGVTNYGYPDPTYLERVKYELRAYGIE